MTWYQGTCSTHPCIAPRVICVQHREYTCITPRELGRTSGKLYRANMWKCSKVKCVVWASAGCLGTYASVPHTSHHSQLAQWATTTFITIQTTHRNTQNTSQYTKDITTYIKYITIYKIYHNIYKIHHNIQNTSQYTKYITTYVKYITIYQTHEATMLLKSDHK